jgi:hypothetical protein
MAAILQWQGGQMRGADGQAATQAQKEKAAAYNRLRKVRKTGDSTDANGWGVACKVTELYELDPIPGCRQVRHVRVVAHYDASGTLVSIDYYCDCQRAAGTATRSPGACSHALAVHDRRTGGPP